MLVWFNNRPVWVRLVCAIWTALLVAWGSMIYWTHIQQINSAEDQARDFAASVHQMTMAALTGMMITGTVAQRGVYLDQIKNSDNITELEVLRGEGVNQQFGKGSVAHREPDAEESAVLNTGIPLFRVDQTAGYLRAVIPAPASRNYLGKDCLMCHVVPENSVLGAVSMKISLARVNAQASRFVVEFTLLALLLSLPFLFLVYFFINRAVTRPLHQVIDCFDRVGQGHYDNPITIHHEDEIGKVLQNLGSMQQKLKHDVGEAHRVADEMLRIKMALDNVSTGVMIADARRHIIYVNRSAERILTSAQDDIRRDMPGFDARRLLGASIDQFHRNPAHQAALADQLVATHTASMSIGGHAMVIVANPVINEQGKRLGVVVEWTDRSAEVKVEQEVDALVQDALDGEFERRLQLEGKEGFYLRLATGLNRLFETTSDSLGSVAQVLKGVAAGDLTCTVEADYGGVFGQLKDDTNRTVERLRDVVGQIKDAADAINTAAKEIAAGNQDLSSRTEEQATSLEETASSMEEINATVKQNADSARQANELAGSSSTIATHGGTMVRQVVETMTDIQASSQKIVDIVRVIHGIAFQTNILALNAAVEAARAGDQGRGFAVVASEVRSLAQRSAGAAKQIAALITESVNKVETGTRLVNDTGNTMNEVVTSSQQVAHMVQDITNATREQSTGIGQVTLAVSRMEEVTQQNAALVEQAAAAAESLQDQAQALVKAIGIFKLEE
jgi:methyl-accepting chemotaxis protein